MRIEITGKTLASACLLLTALIGFTPADARAGTNGFLVPPIRGTASSQYGYWESFTNAVGLPGNHADQTNATTSAMLIQSTPGAIIAGSGNLYNPSGNSSFTLTNTTPFSLRTAVLQVSTAGAEIDYNSVLLVYADTNGTHTVAPLFRYELARTTIPGLGASVSSLWQWDLAGLGDSNGITTYGIVFNAAGSSLSLDSIVLDTAQPASSNFVDSVAFPQQPFQLRAQQANLTRWSYLASDFSSSTRPTASAFGALGNAPDFDARDAQFLVGWNTTNRIPAGMGAKNYLIHHARVTLTIAAGGQYAYTGKLRDYRTYFPTNNPRYIAPATNTTTVDLFGVGFRGGFTNDSNVYVPWTSTNYQQTSPWSAGGDGYHEVRAAYSGGFNTNGAFVDVGNNIGDDGTNEIVNPYEVAPFAVGQSTNIAEGQLMPAGSQLIFDLNLDDPLIYSYVQQGLNDGDLSFMASCLVHASQPPAPPTFPAFYTQYSAIATATQFPILDLDGEIIRTNVDADADGLPDDWENFYFGSLANGASNSFAGDGVINLNKYLAGTNPQNSTNNFRLLSVQPGTGAAEVHFTTAPRRSYAVAWSDGLPTWQTITNPALTYSSAWLAKTDTNTIYPAPVYAVWQDNNATNAHRVYRISTP